MGSKPKPQAPQIPAKAPTRPAGVAPEDIILGGADNIEGSSGVKGKRALIKPSGFLSGINLGV